MSRQRAHASFRAALVVAVALLGGCGEDATGPEAGPDETGRAKAADGARRPNIVVVMTDDQPTSAMRALPRTRRVLARRGTTFDDFVVTDPLCCPSRATFLTGQYAHNHGVISNGGPHAFRAFDERDTIAVALRKAGYRTALAGKYLNDYGSDNPKHVPRGWDDWRAILEPTTQRYFDYELNENGRIRRYGTAPADYKTRVIGRKARAAIRRTSRDEHPLFLFVAFNAPHSPSTADPRDDFALPAPRPRPPSFDEADLSDKPSFIRDRPPFDSEALVRISSRDRESLRSLRAVDREIQRIVGTLRRTGELDRTYVFFTSDNGYLGGEHRIEFGKLLPYTESSRVPLIVRGPAVPSGRRAPALAANVDLAPTLLDLAGAEPEVEVDGRPLLPPAKRADNRAVVIEQLVRDRSAYYGHPYRAIRTSRYLYVEYSTGDRELYDLERDPHELDSRHRDPDYARIRRTLAVALDDLSDCVGRDCELELAVPPPTRGGG